MTTIVLGRLRPVSETRAPAPGLDETVARSLAAAVEAQLPFFHLRFKKLLPASITAALGGLPCPPPPQAWGGPVEACGPGARRRMHRLHPRVADAAPACRALARTFAAPSVTALVSRRAGVAVADCALRLSLVQEVDGYACEPRTAEGEARFRIIVALPPSHQPDLGPDLYSGPQTWAAQLRWPPGAALAFAPAADTWHGFEPRLIRRLRTTLVIDYVGG
jgi:hypothetical protein